LNNPIPIFIYFTQAPGEGGVYIFVGKVVSNDYNFWLELLQN
jgi:hypothetical protein